MKKCLIIAALLLTGFAFQAQAKKHRHHHKHRHHGHIVKKHHPAYDQIGS